MKLKEAAAEYMEEKRRTRRANTVEGYESALRCHVLPRWGDVDIEDIECEDVQAWVLSFDKPGAAKKAFKTLRQVLRWTIRRHKLRIWLATDGVELPRMPFYRPRTLDAREIGDLQRGLWGHPLEALVLVASDLGLRPGEACAVDLERDVDWRSGEVRVGKSRQTVRGQTVTFAAKTVKSNRLLYLSKHAFRRLRQIRREVGSDILRGMRPDQAFRRVKSYCRRTGLPWAGMRSLRHSWATLAIEAGVGIETVALMLGHTEIGTAYEHYIRPRRSVCAEAQKAVEEAIMRAAV